MLGVDGAGGDQEQQQGPAEAAADLKSTDLMRTSRGDLTWEAVAEAIMENLERSIAARGGTGRRAGRLLMEGTWPAGFDWLLDEEPSWSLWRRALVELRKSGRLTLEHVAWIGWTYLVPVRRG